jgi:acetolactate synthase-1/2/3 large subunit
VNPDFIALARTFGIDAERVTEPAGLQGALRSALAANAPALIEVACGPMSNVWPVIGPAGGVYPVLLDPPNVT